MGYSRCSSLRGLFRGGLDAFYERTPAEIPTPDSTPEVVTTILPLTGLAPSASALVKATAPSREEALPALGTMA